MHPLSVVGHRGRPNVNSTSVLLAAAAAKAVPNKDAGRPQRIQENLGQQQSKVAAQTNLSSTDQAATLAHLVTSSILIVVTIILIRVLGIRRLLLLNSV